MTTQDVFREAVGSFENGSWRDEVMSILFGVVLCACHWAQRGATMTVYAEVPTWHPTAVYDDGTR